MNKYLFKTLLVTGLVFVTPVSFSEDIDLYISGIVQDAAKNAQVLIIFDTSGSMDSNHTVPEAYDSSLSYTYEHNDYAFDDNTLYYDRDDDGEPGNKNTNRKFSASINGCESSQLVLAEKGIYVGKVREYRDGEWDQIRSANNNNEITLIDCEDDAYVLNSNDAIVNEGYTTNGSGISEGYPRNGDNTQIPNAYYDNSTPPVTTNIDWDDQPDVTLYTGKYLRWFYEQNVTMITEKRLVTAKRSIISVIESTSDVNFGLEAFNYNFSGSWSSPDTDNAGNGGRIVLGTKEMTTANQTNLIAKINSLTGKGSTPLCESVYEASLYFSGDEIDYGDRDRNTSGYSPNTPPWDTSLVTGGKYISPFTDCASTIAHVILVTDGEPQFDNNADSKLSALRSEELRVDDDGEPILDVNGDLIYDEIAFDNTSTNPDYTPFASGNADNDPSYLPALAAWMSNNDINLDLAGKQTVITHTIGFSSGAEGAKSLLDETAKRSGGKSLVASSESELTTALKKILLDLPKANDTLTAASVAANNFDRTQTLDHIYFAMFEPQAGPRWKGNLKKYKVINKEIADVNDENAMCEVDGRTSVCDDAQSYWSSSEDGNDVGEGGVAEWFSRHLPTERTLYTDLTSSSLATFNETNLLAAFSGTPGFISLADELGVAGSVDGNGNSTEAVEIDKMLAWATGADVDNENVALQATMRDDVFGDPLHSKPVVINYGTSIRIVIGTNAGALHMFEDHGATVDESWAFMPKEFIGNIELLRANEITDKVYGIDGEITVYLNDVGGDGEIGTGDTAILFFGLRRGGSSYYAVDVSNPDSPQLLWHIDNQSTGFGNLGQSWSQPKIGYSKVNASGSTVSPVLFIGGGYDENKDEAGNATPDSQGIGIYMLDAITGDILWDALPANGDTTFGGLHGIASPIAILDSTGDGLIDRLYASDTGGSIWRVDMPGSDIAAFSAFELARLGGGDDDQRFFSEPSIARSYISETIETTVGSTTTVSHQEIPYDAVLVGSGDRSDPLGVDTDDTLYMIKDRNVITQTFPSTGTPVVPIPTTITKATLSDYTGNPHNGTLTQSELIEIGSENGWFVDLLNDGEKTSAPAIVINGVAYFTTYTPAADQTVVDCKPPEGTGSLYALDLEFATKVHNITNNDDLRDNDDRVIILGQDWPAPPSIVIVPNPDDPDEIQNNLTYKDKFIDVDTIFGTQRNYIYSKENQ